MAFTSRHVELNTPDGSDSEFEDLGDYNAPSGRLVDEGGRNENGVREVVIAVMGVTGAGKSYLIRAITEKAVRVGDGLEACTQAVEGVTMKYRDVSLTLLDSPGFKDTYRSDTDVLYEISSYLAGTYSQGSKLSGIIYVHPITDVRMDGPSLRSLRMFRKLVGEDSLDNIILATTHWGEVEEETGRRREADLVSKFWKPFLDGGARMVRYDGGRESGLALVDMLVNKSRVVLDIQRETVDEKKDLIDTGAGQVLNEELRKIQAMYQEELKKHKEELELADEKSKKEIAAIMQEMGDKLAEAERAREDLRRAGTQRDRQQRDFLKKLQLQQLVHQQEKATLEKRQNELTSLVQELQAQVNKGRGAAPAASLATVSMTSFVAYLG
ncbi:P-loop containing nucleoside triphosphate hydrolase protein [Lasiosphaeria ovina]|uniref:P-loop containing nucleoside triphosphate hydrolase protein n=1 Tax=Lasiosphaeria ovina TaxID=92902 RepID=A0AAE0TX09_9PEZI|nr:P-loop containing nucleoside triphosphate hydrolase protein [Lasiosphaeria ovina]